MNKEFYERVLVAKYIVEKFAKYHKEMSINEAYYYVQQKEDASSVDMIWLTIAGNYITWEDHLEDICCKVLGFNICQPGYSPFTVSQQTLDGDPRYKDWYCSTWLPYIHGLINKYMDTLEARLGAKIQRGMVDIVSEIKSEVGDNLVKPLSVF